MFSRQFGLIIVLLMSFACSHWSPQKVLGKRALSSENEQTSFTVYHNIQPSRRSGGSIKEIKFQNPKHLKELSLEFVNYKVSVKKIELVNSKGQVIPVRGFNGHTLSSKQRHITLRNLPTHKDIMAVRILAEGFTNDDVIFTASFFSPQGFLASEQGKPRFKMSSLSLNTSNMQVPVCLQTQKNLSGVLFDIEKINQLEVSERRYFCQHFLKEFTAFLATYPEVASFLRVGENLEKPLVVLGSSFSFDRYKNEVSFPMLLQKKDFSYLISDFRTSTRTDSQAVNRRISQQFDQDQYDAENLSYDEYMETGTQSVSYLEYQDKWSFEEGESSQLKCSAMMNELGLPKSVANRNCEDVVGFEEGHIGCMQELSELHIMSSNIHHYCLEARGKLAFYRPCMNKMVEMNFNHYDSNLFCQRTPKDYMSGQLQCLDVMLAQGYSQHKSVQTCQAKWGKESNFIVCLDEQKQRVNDNHARLRYCASR